MKKTSLVTILSLVTGIMVIMLIVQPAFAVRVEGSPIALEIGPGTTSIVPIALVIPSGEQADSFILSVAGLGQQPLDGTYTDLDASSDTSPYSARTFISLSGNDVRIQPGERAVINATIAVPADARDGGRYAVIAIHPSGSGQPVTTTDMLVPVLLTIKGGNSTGTGEISGLDFSTAESGAGLRIGTTFQNTGNYHLSGLINTVTVTDSKGTLVARSTTKPLLMAVIPGQEVRFDLSIGYDLPDDAYILTSRIEKQDGSLLAEQSEPLPGRVEEAPEPTGESLPPGENTEKSVPGFGVLAALAGLVCGVLVRNRKNWGK